MQPYYEIIPISAFEDNYIWLIHNKNDAAIVDPGDAAPVIEMLLRLKLNLEAILITHHHHDHIGGVKRLMEVFPQAKIYAPQQEHYDFQHIPVKDADIITLLKLNITFKVIHLPGHTLGHIAYCSEERESKLLFCGDTLFGAGCGRLFEGTALQMFNSLQKLGKLPAETKVYCAHEYTLHNVNFALILEPNNRALTHRFNTTTICRQQNIPSLPSTIELELATNPFLRCDSKEIQTTIGLNNYPAEQIFSALRAMRNHY